FALHCQVQSSPDLIYSLVSLFCTSLGRAPPLRSGSLPSGVRFAPWQSHQSPPGSSRRQTARHYTGV
ncbi:MAG: hypothetical protein K1X37_09070, partial [Saprospiraceae bacterium]|nr:hypothetical protein [Saprospiraceae bacterium]